MPSDVKSLGIDPDQYKRAMQYEFDKLAFEMYVYSVKTGLDCIFYLTYVMPLVWDSVTKLFPFIEPTSEFQRGVMFLLLEALKSKFIDVPIALYETFVIQEKYGFNKKTLVLFFNDICIEAGSSVIAILAVLYGYIYIVDKSVTNEWFFFNIKIISFFEKIIYLKVFLFPSKEIIQTYLLKQDRNLYSNIYVCYFIVFFNSIMNIYLQGVEIFLIIANFAIMTIHPNFIAPLFNQFQDMEDGELKQDINDLAVNINFPLKNILIMDGSKRSDHSNAYFFGLWKNKRIVLYDTLLRQMSQNEIMAVVGHELGHWKHEHSKINFLIYCLRIIVSFSLFSFFRNNDSIFLSFGFSDKSTFIGTALFFNLFLPINSVIEIISLVITRYFEFQADTFSCNLGYGYYLMSGLTKIQRENVSTLNPDPWYAWFKYSHPGLFERLKRIKLRLSQIEKQNGMENQQIQEKIQNFLEEYVSYSGKNHNSQSGNSYYISSSNQKKQLGSQYQGFIKEHGSQLNQLNLSLANSLYNTLDRNGSNSLNSSISYPINNHQGEIDSNSNQIGNQQVLNNKIVTNFANPNINNGFNLNLLFNYEQQQQQQQQYLMQQYNLQNLQRLQMQQQLWQDQQTILNRLKNQQYFQQQQQQHQNQNGAIQLGINPLIQQQQIQATNTIKNVSQKSNSNSSYILNNKKQYKHSFSNFESIDSHDYSSSVDINHPNKKLYKEDVYLLGGNFPSADIKKKQGQGNSSRPQSPPDFSNDSIKNKQNNIMISSNEDKKNRQIINSPYNLDKRELNQLQNNQQYHSSSKSSFENQISSRNEIIHRNGKSNDKIKDVHQQNSLADRNDINQNNYQNKNNNINNNKNNNYVNGNNYNQKQIINQNHSQN